MLSATGLVGAWVYMGREWEEGEDIPKVSFFSLAFYALFPSFIYSAFGETLLSVNG